MRITRSCLGLALLILAPGPAFPAAAREVHFSPEERLDTIDAALIGGARWREGEDGYLLDDVDA